MEQRENALIIYTAAWCGDAWRVLQLLDDYEVAYTAVDVDQDPAAADRVRELNGGHLIIPTLVFPEGDHMAEPSNARLMTRLKLEPDGW